MAVSAMTRNEGKAPVTSGTKDPLPFPHLLIGRSPESKENLETHVSHFRRNFGFKDLQVHNDKIHCLAWSKDGKYLATGSYDKTIVLWSFKDQKLTREYSLKGHTHSVDQIVWHPTNPDQLLSLSSDKTVKVWAVKNRVALHTFPVRVEAINISWAPDGESFVIGDKEDTLTFTHIEKNSRIEKKFLYEVNEMIFRQANGTTYLFLAGGHPTGHGGCLEYFEYNFPSLTPINSLRVSGQTCVAVEMDPNGRYFAIGGNDSNITLWNLNGLFPMQEITRHKTVVRSVSFSHDSRFFASTTGEDGYIDIALVETGENVWSYHSDEREKETLGLVAIAFHPKRHILACAYDLKDRHKETSMIRLFGVTTVPDADKDKKKETKRESRGRSREREREREKDSTVTRNSREDPKVKEASKVPEKPKFESKFSFLKPTKEQLSGLEERKAAQAAKDAKAAAAAKMKEQAAAAAKVSTRINLKPGVPLSDQPSRSRLREPIRPPGEASHIRPETAHVTPPLNVRTDTVIKKPDDRSGVRSSSVSVPPAAHAPTKKEGSRSRPSSGSRKSDPEDQGPDRKKRRSATRETDVKSKSTTSSVRNESKK